jgi:hypothetical protein
LSPAYRCSGAIGQRGIELVEQRLGVVEAAAVAIETSFAQKAEGDSGLAGAGRPDEQDIVGAAQEVEAGKRVDLRPVDAPAGARTGRCRASIAMADALDRAGRRGCVGGATQPLRSVLGSASNTRRT